MQIKTLTQDRYSEYQVICNEFGSVFNQLNWLSLFGDKVKIYTINNNEDKIIGGFFVYTEKLMNFKLLRNAPFTPSNGLFFISKASNNAKVNSDQKSLMMELSSFYESQQFGILRVPFPISINDFQPFIWLKFKVIPNYTYIHKLDKSIEDLFASFSPEKRNEIKKAEKDRVEIVIESNHQVIFELIEDTLKRNRIKYNRDILRKILLTFSNENNSFAYVAKNINGIMAFSFCLHDNKTAYYLFGGHSKENGHPGAGSASLWECIKYAKSIGLQIFDFEGSMNPSIEQYFRGFGGTLTPYFTINKAMLPIEMILKLFKREYF